MTLKNKKTKKNRRVHEAKKASRKVSGQRGNVDQASEMKSGLNEIPKNKETVYNLPIKNIKRDIFRDFVYLGLAIALIFALKYSGVGFQEIRSYFGI